MSICSLNSFDHCNISVECLDVQIMYSNGTDHDSHIVNTGADLFLAGADQLRLRDNMSMHGSLNDSFGQLVQSFKHNIQCIQLVEIAVEANR